MFKNEIKPYQKPIFFDCKGSLDDYIALMSILTLDKYSLTGIVITPVYCDSGKSIELILKILDLFCRHDIKIAINNIEPVNEYT
jgi:inosine-uridine nucleoside N-ribohydrolase